MIPVESNTPLKYISWIIFLLQNNLSPFCGDRLMFSSVQHMQFSLGKGKALGQVWEVTLLGQGSGVVPIKTS